MEDEFVHKNPQDALDEIFFRLEEKVNITRNMALLMEALTKNVDLSKRLVAINQKLDLMRN
jgi:hypothetical protein